MIRNVLTSIGGISLYGVISICIFIGVFLIAAVWAVMLKKSYLESMQRLPLDDEPAREPEGSNPLNEL
jgi:hypothetical protein